LLINELLASLSRLSPFIHRLLDFFILLNTFGGIIEHGVLDDVATELQVFLRCVVRNFGNYFLVLLNELR
jgi:hypothetical protein